MKKPNFDPMKRRVYKYNVAMQKSFERMRELYPTDVNFAVSGSIGNERQYPKEFEWK